MTQDDTRLFQDRVVNMNEDEMKLLKENETTYPHLGGFNADLNEKNRRICYFHSNKEVKNMNVGLLRKMNTLGAISVAFNRLTGPNLNNKRNNECVLSRVKDDTTHSIDNMSLVKKLKLKIGARYMITTNIDTSDGLVNGTTGYLKRIDFGSIPDSILRKPLQGICF